MFNRINSKIKQLLMEDSGMTLVELLASILLLSLIVSSFLSFFVQAAQTNKQIDTINEATFLAQEQMEILTATAPEMTAEDALGSYPQTKNDYTIGLEMKGTAGLDAVIVTVSKEGKELAKMETRLSFKEN